MIKERIYMKKNIIQYSLIAFMLIIVLLIYPIMLFMFDIADTMQLSEIEMTITHSAVILAITGVVVFLFKSKISEHCKPMTTFVALSLSAVCSLGLWALFNIMIFSAFGETNQHPIRYPATMMIAPVSLVLFIILICVYGFLRKKKFFCIGTLIDAIVAIVYIWPFFLILGITDGIISDWLAAYYDKIG